MFFSIGLSIDPRFPNNYQKGNLWINCDNGWLTTPGGFYKGYKDNDCSLVITDTGIQIDHSNLRSFPLWYNNGSVTNLEPLSNQAWTDQAVTINQDGTVAINKLNIDLTVPDERLSIQEATSRIRSILDNKVKSAPDNLKLFVSGGLDTLLLYSMLSGRQTFELVTGEHYDVDDFTTTNQEALTKFWGYQQMHHWREPTWFATGSHGDEYFLRGPATIAMLASWHNINLGELLSEDYYHYRHFSKYSDLWKTSWDNRKQLQQDYPTINDLHRQILNILVNDHQHWHLGNTLTWTPFMDINITKILLQCDINELIPQFLDGRLSKNMIIDYNPKIIDYLSQYKNYNSRENLAKLVV